MPKILAASHALAPHRVLQAEVKNAVGRLFAGTLPELDRLMSIFDNSRIEQRHFMMPLEWYLASHGRTERNRVYLEKGLALLQEAARTCLGRAQRRASSIDHVICVSTTGLATPSLDAHLINALGIPRTASRLPIWGLGCAGGAAGISRAQDYCRAHPRATVLLVALECCSLTFLEEDQTKKNLVATSLFADGAAAVLVGGDEIEGAGPQIVANGSYLFADSSRVMGWDFGDSGMELVLSPRLPAIIRSELPALLDAFLTGQGQRREHLTDFITHPGGARVIDAYRLALDLPEQALALTERHLRHHGNLSSVSVLMVLEDWLQRRWVPSEGLALLSAFGPGFSAEMLLLKG